MEASTEYQKVSRGEGYAVGHLDDLGDGPGFRKVRKGLEVTAFGVNAIVMPPGIETGFHYHDVQEELYFIHRGVIEMEFGDGSLERSKVDRFDEMRVKSGRASALDILGLPVPGEGDEAHRAAGGTQTQRHLVTV